MDKQTAAEENAARAEHALRCFAEALDVHIQRELESQEAIRQYVCNVLPWWAFIRHNNLLYEQVHSFGVEDRLQEYKADTLSIVDQVGDEPVADVAMRVASLMANCFDAGGVPYESRKYLVDAIQYLAQAA